MQIVAGGKYNPTEVSERILSVESLDPCDGGFEKPENKLQYDKSDNKMFLDLKSQHTFIIDLILLKEINK